MAPSIWQLLIVLVIVLLLFGTKRLRNIGGDLGGAIRGFRSSMKGQATPEEPDSEKLTGENSTTSKSEAHAEEKDKTAAS